MDCVTEFRWEMDQSIVKARGLPLLPMVLGIYPIDNVIFILLGMDVFFGNHFAFH